MFDLKGRNKYFLLLGIISLVMIVFTLFITVYDQIIIQNQGFFYAVIFGGILVLAFVLCNLFTKLVAASVNTYEAESFRIIVYIIFAIISVAFLFMRLRYDSSLPSMESNVVKTGYFIAENTLEGNNDLIFAMRMNPSHFLYAMVFSFVFNIFGQSDSVVVVVNAVFMLLASFMAFKVVDKLADKVCALITVFVFLLMPGQAFAVYSYSSEPLLAFLIFSFLNLFVIMYVNIDTDFSERNRMLYTIGCGIVAGLLIFTEPTLLIGVILTLVGLVVLKKSDKNQLLIVIAATIGSVILFGFIKMLVLGIDFGTLISDFFSSFNCFFNSTTGGNYTFSEIKECFIGFIDNQNRYINDNYFFLSGTDGAAYSALNAAWLGLLNQLLYMFFLVLSIMCLYYAAYGNRIETMPVWAVFTSIFISIFLQSVRACNTFSFNGILIILSALCMKYLYLNHHPDVIGDSFVLNINEVDTIKDNSEGIAEESVNNKDTDTPDELPALEDFRKRANALIFIGVDEELYQQIKREELENAPKRIAMRKVDEAHLIESNTSDDAMQRVIDVFPNAEHFDTGMSDSDEEELILPEGDFYLDDDDLSIPKAEEVVGVATDNINDAISQEISSSIEDWDEEKSESELEDPNAAKAIKAHRERVAKQVLLEQQEAEKLNRHVNVSSGIEHTVKDGITVRRVKTVVSMPAGAVNASAPNGLEIFGKKSSEGADNGGKSVNNSGKIHNPLPEPVRHEKKEMDYNLDSSTDNDFSFDFNISDEDDFDI